MLIRTDIEKGVTSQFVVPRGVWHGLRLVEGGKFALLESVIFPLTIHYRNQGGKAPKRYLRLVTNVIPS